MGRVNVNWITGVHSGRACRHDNIYTKVDRKTGACYSVALCNPNTNWNEAQLQQRANFGAISSDSNPFLIEQTASFRNRDAIEHNEMTLTRCFGLPIRVKPGTSASCWRAYLNLET